VRFPPIKSGRALVWITLHPDAGVSERYAALHGVLKSCHLHPLDTTGASELVIVEEAALREQLGAVRAVLGAGDMLHLIARQGERLSVEVIAPLDVEADSMPDRPAERRPPWLAG
jgi:hypothetical protein